MERGHVCKNRKMPPRKLSTEREATAGSPLVSRENQTDPEEVSAAEDRGKAPRVAKYP